MPAAATREVQVPQKKRPRGHPKVSATFWCPSELRKWLDATGESFTDAVVERLDLAQALQEVLGEELWLEVRRRAIAEDAYEGQALGKVLGQLARESLEKKGGKR